MFSSHPSSVWPVSPEVACHIVPGDAVAIVIVECGQARLIVKLLQALNCHSYVKLCLDRSFLQTFKIVGLRHTVPVVKGMGLVINIWLT